MRGRSIVVAAWFGFLGLWPQPVDAAFSSNQAGTSGAQFLSLGLDARALGMGEAMTSVPDGPHSLYWNPAALAALPNPEISLSHTQLFSDFYFDSLSYGRPVSSLKGVVAANFSLLNQTGITAVTNTAQPLPGTFSPYSSSLSLGYARQMGPLQAGAALKGIKEQLYDASAYAAALDAGVLYSWDKRLNLGFAFRNWGTKEKFVNQSFPLPFEFDLGASYGWSDVLFAADLSFPYYGATNAKFGFEYRAAMSGNSAYALRAGYKTLPAYDLNVLSGITIGGGFELNRFSFDFGFEPMGGLGQVYRFSLGYRWQ